MLGLLRLLRKRNRLRALRKWLVFAFFMIGLAILGNWYTLLFIIDVLVGMALCTVLVLEQVNEVQIMVCGVKRCFITRKS